MIPRMSMIPQRRVRRRRPLQGVGCIQIMAAAVFLSVAAPLAATAQVLEVGDGGEVTVYDRPSVFDAKGGVPIGETRQATPARTVDGAPSALASAADAAELSPELVEAVAWRESRLRPRVVSPAGAIGEMQLMPGTARALGVDPYDSAQNYRGGAAYLSGLMRRYDGDLVRALAAYNAGPGAVDRYRGVPPYKETRDYVGAIMDRLSRRADAGVETPRKGL